jgi:hypothetical protein
LKLGLDALAPIAIAMTDSPSAIRMMPPWRSAKCAALRVKRRSRLKTVAATKSNDAARNSTHTQRASMNAAPIKRAEAPRLKGATPKIAFAAAPRPFNAKAPRCSRTTKRYESPNVSAPAPNTSGIASAITRNPAIAAISTRRICHVTRILFVSHA